MFISNWPNKAEKEGKFFFKRNKRKLQIALRGGERGKGGCLKVTQHHFHYPQLIEAVTRSHSGKGMRCQLYILIGRLSKYVLKLHSVDYCVKFISICIFPVTNNVLRAYYSQKKNYITFS